MAGSLQQAAPHPALDYGTPAPLVTAPNPPNLDQSLQMQ